MNSGGPAGLVVVEDDLRYRASLERLIRLAPDFRLAATFGDVGSLLAAAGDGGGASPRWDLVLMDLELPDGSGVEATRRLKRRLPAVTVVALTVFEDPATVLETICAGADGYLLKRTDGEELLDQLRAVLDGGSPLSGGVARTVLDLVRERLAPAEPQAGAPSCFDLTDREQQVLRCLVDGLAYKQVASHLGISIHTVREHVRRIYRKLQVHSVAEAVRRALRRGIV